MSWFDWTHKIDLLAYDQGLLTFQSDRRLRSQAVKVECRLGKLEHVKARVRVLQEIPSSSLLETRVQDMGYSLRSHFYEGRLEEPSEGEQHLAALLDPLHVQRRREPRIAHRFKVLSRDLPGYWALACDISLSGIGLKTIGPVKPGTRAHLTLELDTQGAEPIEVDTSIRWCRQNDEWMAGAEFDPLPRQERNRLERHLQQLASVPEP